MDKTIYAVGAIFSKKKVELPELGIIQELELKWAKGMIGIIPCFDNEKDAKIFANGKADVIEFNTVKKAVEEGMLNESPF